MVVVPELVDGRVRWLAGRAIRPEAPQRFQSLPGPKPLLGLGQLPAPTPWLVLTEGLFDWLVLAAWGLPAVAALGTQGAKRIAAALRPQPRVLLAFDSDPAGREASAQLIERLGPLRTATIRLPEGVCDVGDLARQPDGRAIFLSMLRQAARARTHQIP